MPNRIKNKVIVSIFNDRVEVGSESRVWTTYHIQKHKFSNSEKAPLMPIISKEILLELRHYQLDFGYEIEFQLMEDEDYEWGLY